jgi:P4 family phage/plasmid primase-like protien
MPQPKISIAKMEIDFEDFLSKYAVTCKDVEFTHTRFGGPYGKYNIPDNKMEKFYKLYNPLVGKIFLNMTEKPNKIGMFTIDIDWKFDKKNSDRQYTSKHVKWVVEAYLEKIKHYLDIRKKDCKAFVLEKECPTYDQKKKLYSDGLHIQLPYAALNPKIRQVITNDVYQKAVNDNPFHDIPHTNKLKDVFDVAVISRNQWFMYGSGKKDATPYALTTIYSHNMNKLKIDKQINWNKLPELFSVRKSSKSDEIGMSKKLKKKKGDDFGFDDLFESLDIGSKNTGENRNKNKDEKKSSKKKSKIINRENKELDLEISKIKELVKLLSRSRAENYGNWSRVGWCLHNLSDDLYDDWISFSSKCPAKFSQRACDKLWDNAKGDGLSVGSLCHWAKEDNPKGYSEFMRSKIEHLLLRALSCTSSDIVEVIHAMYSTTFKCACIKPKVWFEFKSHKWKNVQEGHTLYSCISKGVVAEFKKLGQYCYQKAHQLGDDEAEAWMKKRNKVDKIIEKLKQNKFKKDLMEECAIRFFDEEFEKKVNDAPNLLGFNNGVYDLDLDHFRSGSPDDYLTFSTGYDYIDFDGDEEVFDFINKFLATIQKNEAEREYLLRLSASFLCGRNKEQQVRIWIGGGSNGKSTFMNLVALALGDYYDVVPPTLITRKRAQAGAATPELADKNGKRLLSLNEPEEDETVQVGILKELSGSDWIMARALYGNPFKYKPQFKMVLLCNNLPRVTALDRGTWRRVRVIRWLSEFIDSLKNKENDNQFLKDDTLEDRMKEWPEAFMWLLLNKYKEYKKTGLMQPKSVKVSTSEYKKNSDVYYEFILEHLYEAPKRVGEKMRVLYRLFRQYYADSRGSSRAPDRKIFETYLGNNKYHYKNGTLYGYKLKISGEFGADDKEDDLECFDDNNDNDNNDDNNDDDENDSDDELEVSESRKKKKKSKSKKESKRKKKI